MRVLHVLHTSLPHVCGYSIRSDQILSNQQRHGIHVAVVTSAQQPASPMLEENLSGIGYYRTSCPVLLRSPIRELQLMWALKKRLSGVIDDYRPDIVHAHSPILVGLPAYLAANRKGIPFVYEVRDLWENASVDRGKFTVGSMPYNLARSLETWLLRRADAVVTIGKALQDELRGRTTRDVIVTQNGTDPDAFQPLVPQASWQHEWNPDNKQIIAYVGSFQPYEGLDILIKSVRHILHKLNDVRVLIVGDGPERIQLESLARNEGVQANVVFTGRIPHQRVKEIYAIADLLVYPRIDTLTTRLTTPLKPLEALSMEKAVIASNLPAIKELVSHGKTGILFKPGDAEDLATKAVELLLNPDLRKELGKRGRTMVLQERQWSTSVAKYEPLYKGLIAARQRHE